MIGIVLAAGAGRRLRPETDGIPKALLAVDGERTILDLILRNLAAAGVIDVVVVVGHAGEAVRRRERQLAGDYGLTVELVDNDRAQEWNNAYSLWLARKHLPEGALLVNGDTVHPASVEEALLAARGADPRPAVPGADLLPGSRGADLLLAVDDRKALGGEEMKVVFDGTGRLARIHKGIDPAAAHGEYIGVALIESQAAEGLTGALAATWQRDPGLYYEDGFQEYADRGGELRGIPIGAVGWVEVDDHADLARARELAGSC